MRIRDKIITAACLTPDGIEWTTLKIKQDGNEPVEQSSFPFPMAENGEGVVSMSAMHLSDDIREKIAGDLTVSIRTSELLMRTMEFPATDPGEIASMVGFQIDKVSPFPLDQLAVSHEILRETETGTLVLMAAVKHDRIDAIGDIFSQKGLHIHSIDARILGWLDLFEQGKHLSGHGCEILIVDDGIDFALAVLLDGVPIAFRSLPKGEEEEKLADELANETAYTLTTLDTEYNLPTPKAIDIWNLAELPISVISALQQKTGLTVRQNNLSALPPLSEGIIHRALHKKNRIELIPREWIEHQRFKTLKRKSLISCAVIGSVWLTVLLALTIVYQTRAIALKNLQKKEAALAPVANKAIENRKKLRALQSYADRSHSALECLREVTHLLPAGDIDFASYKYNKDKGVTVQGTAESDDLVIEYWNALSDSDMFLELKDQNTRNQTKQGVERAVYLANLTLPSKEDDK